MARTSVILLVVVFTLTRMASPRALADGCFVFKWNKAIDINEPTQKGIILHDAGREDLLLQVKYEGPLEEFGWLIPVPSLPKVEKGSMEPFYELSQLTQRRFGVATKGFATLGAESRGGIEESVKVIETKTVGAYEVSILSAQDSGSLSRWLQAHDYSIPGAKREIVEEYIRKGWYFIAAKIQLNKGISFKAVSSTSPKDADAAGKAREAVQKKLSSGELHPLLISFDTAKCIFPLKISAVGGNPSEVSLYVLSAEPLLNKFIFDRRCAQVNRRYIEWNDNQPERERARLTSLQNMRSMTLAWQLYAATSSSNSAFSGRRPNWQTEDLLAMSKEGAPQVPPRSLDDGFYAAPEEMLQCLLLTPDKMPQSAKKLPRLKSRNWYLTKLVQTFTPAEMHDLDFQAAVPALVAAFPQPAGCIAADVLARFGSNAMPALLSACKSTNSNERLCATRGLEHVRDADLNWAARTLETWETSPRFEQRDGRVIERLRDLLEDEDPRVRLHAVRAAAQNWSLRLADVLIALFRDSYSEIRSEASGCLAERETAQRAPTYLKLLKDPDLNVRIGALGVLLRINRDAIPAEPLVEMLKDLRENVHGFALHTLWKLDRDVAPRSELLPLLASPQPVNIWTALGLIEGSGRIQGPLPEPEASVRAQGQRARQLSSAEASLLATNRLAEARFGGLRILERNADAAAVELTLPLLRDTNSIVRHRAFVALQTITGQNISDNDPAKLEAWWAANKATFKPRKLEP